MIIHRLEIESFGIIGNKLSLTFPEQGKIGIFGVNESGKSTLFRAIEFALFGLRGKSSPSLNRENVVTWGKKRAKVMLEFSSGSNRYQVERVIGAQSGHEARLYGEAKLIEHSIVEIEREIEEIIGMDRHTFTKLIYIKQKELDALKELGRAGREALVNRLIRIEVFDQANENLKEQLRQLEILLAALEGERNQLAAEHRRYQDLRRRRRQLEHELAQREKSRLDQNKYVQALTSEFCKLNWLKQHSDLSALHQEKQRNIENLEKQLDQRKKLQKELASIQKEIEDYEALQAQYQKRFEALTRLHQQLIEWERQADACEKELKRRRVEQQKLAEKLVALTSEMDKAQREYDVYLWVKRWYLLQEQVREKERRKKELKERFNEQQQIIKEHEGLTAELTVASALLNEHGRRWDELVKVLQEAQIIQGQVARHQERISDLQQRRDRLLAGSPWSKDDLRILAISPVQHKQRSLVIFFICVMAVVLGVALAFVPSVGLVSLMGLLAAVPAYVYYRHYWHLDQLDTQHRQLLNLEQQIQQEETEYERQRLELSRVLGEEDVASSDELRCALDQLKSLFRERAGVDSLDALREKTKGLRESQQRCEEQLRRLEEQQLEAAIQAVDQELEELRQQLEEMRETQLPDWVAFEYSAQALTQNEKALRKAEKMLIAARQEEEGIVKHIKELEDQKSELQKNKDSALMQHDFSDLKQIEDALGEIIMLLEKEAGVRSFDALVEKIKNLREQQTAIEQRLQELIALKIEDTLEQRRHELQEIEEKQAELSQEKPEDVEGIKFSDRSFKHVQKELESARAELHNIEGAIKEGLGALAQIDQSLKELEGIEERLSSKEQEYQEQCYQRQILERLRQELDETSRALRNQVIPHAEMLINNMLPTITGSRYFQLKIDDDLRFKVYSREAGAVKERDIFSGGTQDQFLIALRLAFTQSILDSKARADKYCLLMDECISSSDEFRKQGIFTVLDYLRRVFAQIFIIAHEDITSDVDYALHLRRGKDGFTEIANKNW